MNYLEVKTERHLRSFFLRHHTDRDRAVWRETLQLSTPGLGEVDVVRLPRTGRTGVGTGNVPLPSFVASL